jgi:uncharacterized membrane protein YbhN (UPF0104 family)
VKKGLKTLGNVAVVVSLVFLCKKFVDLNIDKTLFFRADNVAHISWISLLYGAHLFVVCVPWKVLLRILTGRKIPFFEAAWVLNRSNLMKYLPGNFFQFIGRNELAIRLGLPHADVAFATVCDVALLVAANCLTAVFLDWRAIGRWFERYGFSGLYFLFLLVALAGTTLIVLRRTRKDVLSAFGAKLMAFCTWRSLGAVLACTLYFILLALFVAVLFVAIFTKILHVDVEIHVVPTILSAYMFSWSAGFIMPGAPGGVGIREATLTLLLTGVVAADDALLAAVIFRVVTTVGDLWGLLFAWLGMNFRVRWKANF